MILGIRHGAALVDQACIFPEYCIDKVFVWEYGAEVTNKSVHPMDQSLSCDPSIPELNYLFKGRFDDINALDVG